MCGRFIQTADPEKIRAILPDIQVDDAAADGFRPRYNIAPTQDVLTVLNTPPPRLTTTRWGLIPPWAKDAGIGNRMINARAETLESKPSYRDPFRKRRCIIFADGFYEWKGTGKTRIPYLIRFKSGEPFAMAGLWDRWRDTRTGHDLLSSTIVTTAANALIAGIHDRMPVILEPGACGLWLSPAPAPGTELAACLRPFDDARMEAYEVSRLVNNPSNESSECIRPV